MTQIQLAQELGIYRGSLYFFLKQRNYSTNPMSDEAISEARKYFNKKKGNDAEEVKRLSEDDLEVTQARRCCPCFKYRMCSGKKVDECMVTCTMYARYLRMNDRMKLGFEYEKDRKERNRRNGND